MPLITKPVRMKTKEKIRVRLDKEVLENMNAYCQWQQIDRDYFIEQAVLAIFKKDADWKAFRKNHPAVEQA